MNDQPDLFASAGWTAPPPAVDYDRIPDSADVPVPPGTYANLEDLAAHCRRCQRCDLGATRLNAVVQRGNPRAPLMVIGEGPGQNEDETGLPYVGKAGQLLDKILQSVGLDPATDVYVTNAVRCRPPGNRVPTPEEIAACRPYLLEQVRLANPKLIILTGATAVRATIGIKEGITRLRGRWLEWEGRPCMPIFHPSYLLRNPSKERNSPKWLMWQDIRAIRARLDELTGNTHA